MPVFIGLFCPCCVHVAQNQPRKISLMTKELPPNEIDEDQLSRSTPDDAAELQDASEGSVEASDTDPPKQPRRKPGRPKGIPKTGGRVKGSPRSYTAPEIRNELLERSNFIGGIADMAFGRKMYCSGPTGKPEWRYPTMRERLGALQYVGDKILPTLAAQELTGASGKDLIPAPQLDTRETAIAVLSLMRDSAVRERGRPDIPIFAHPQPLAGVIDHKQHLEPAPSELEPAPAAAAPVTPAVEPKREYQVGETEVFDNGAYIQLVEIAGSNERKWDIRDELNAPHGYSRDRQAAVTRARALKRAGEQG
jgi:hypothetical protein